MKTAAQKRIDFRNMLKEEKECFVTPCVYDALSGKLAQEAGIRVLAMGGYAIEASRLAQPDVGFLSLTEMTDALKFIADATDIPIIADGDTGYGNALNVIRSEHEFEHAGATCIFFEDQVWPKRCGHMDGKQVISAEEHTQKIRAACDARTDKNTLIMARTDSRYIHGLEDSINRGKMYADAGADIVFLEALTGRDEMERAGREFEGSGAYLYANMIEGGKTPLIPAKELRQMGFAGVFWPCSVLYLLTKTLYESFSVLAKEGTTESLKDQMIDFPKFNSFIGLDTYKELERKYKVDRDD